MSAPNLLPGMLRSETELLAINESLPLGGPVPWAEKLGVAIRNWADDRDAQWSAEVERIAEAARAHVRRAATFEQERDEARAEMERLRAEVLRARGQIQLVMGLMNNCTGPANRTPTRTDAPEGSWVCWPDWERDLSKWIYEAHAALAGAAK